MAATKTERRNDQIRKHGERLLETFPNATERDPVELCKQLRQWERRGARLGLRLCNGPEFPGGYDEADQVAASILNGVDNLLKFKADKIPVFVNRDPRGYALKISDEWMRANRNCRIETDMGGYGLICPEFTGE